MDDSKFFVEWLSRQKPAGILPTQTATVVNIMDRLDTGDLISVMYFGSDSEALRALNLLKDKFEEEQYWMAQMAVDGAVQ